MKQPFQDDFEEETVTFVKMKPDARERYLLRKATHVKPTKKNSYEGSSQVQRWLKEQAYDYEPEVEQQQQSSFRPAFLTGRRDAPWILSSLTPLYDQKLITDIVHEVSSGKEATVFCCVAHPDTGEEFLAAKIYRPRMFRALRNDAVYRYSRVQRDEQGQAEHGNSRRGSAATRKTERGRAAQVASWIEYEYLTQRLMYEHGADVPRPFAHAGNAILMEYIGARDQAALRLSDVELEPEEAREHFACILWNIELALIHGRIHGDLSAHNILYSEGKVTLIDFAQAVDPYHNSDVYSLLARDVERTCQYFARYGLKSDARKLAHDIWTRHMGPIPQLV
ncbi:MAG TPA: RIO1 family regulatory kinase/ATPase [Ktedonobacteraceae bacterium]|nr:RIO1 family regulatory kinase/ATPase [Ktedonobacteraceae bacterium]